MSLDLVTVDSSAIIAVILNEKTRKRLVNLTRGKNIIAPRVLDFEVGNAFSSMFKRKSLELKDAKRAFNLYKKIPIRFVDVDIETSIELAHALNHYAYDCYFLETARKFKTYLLTLDKGLVTAAHKLNISILE